MLTACCSQFIIISLLTVYPLNERLHTTLINDIAGADIWTSRYLTSECLGLSLSSGPSFSYLLTHTVGGNRWQSGDWVSTIHREDKHWVFSSWLQLANTVNLKKEKETTLNKVFALKLVPLKPESQGSCFLRLEIKELEKKNRLTCSRLARNLGPLFQCLQFTGKQGEMRKLEIFKWLKWKSHPCSLELYDIHNRLA